MRTVGFFPMSEADNEVLGIDFNPNLTGGSNITGTPTVTGTNCTATYVDTVSGVVRVRVTDGTYSGSVNVNVVLTDGRDINRKIDLRFL